MAVDTSKHASRKGFMHFVRGLWQRPPNTMPKDAAPLISSPEQANSGALMSPGSDRRFARKEPLQQIAPTLTAEFLATEMKIREKQKGNAAMLELAAYAVHLRRDPRDMDQPNPAALYHDLLRMHPEIDEKPATDWDATRPNKEILPPFQLDAATVQRIKFTRFLMQRGIYNEGFADGEIPAQYRTLEDYTKGDTAEK